MAVIEKHISPINIEERKNADIRPGDTVRVWQKIKEGNKIRLQAFEGTVIARKHGREPGATFTVRRIASGVGVEKIFPLYSPNMERVEVIRRGRVRRAKLYYIRHKAAREIKKKIRQLRINVADVISSHKDEEGDKDASLEKDNTVSTIEKTEENKKEEEQKQTEQEKKESLNN